MSGSFLASGRLEQPETNGLKERPLGAPVPDDRVGKVFGVVGENVRQCLNLRQAVYAPGAGAHAETACRPPQRSFARLGETDHANR
jgi:hypothetical protein